MFRAVRSLMYRMSGCQSEKKQLKLKQILSLAMQPKQTMEKVSLPITSMVPGFFSKELDCRMTQLRKVQASRTNIPSNSFVQLILALSTDGYFNMVFQRLNSKHLRIGRMLEVMDSAAGISSYRFVQGKVDLNAQFTISTACVDSINMFGEMVLGEDVVFRTYVNYVGRTSMEVEVDVTQNNELRASAMFTMVARYKDNPAKAYELPLLNLSEETDMPNAKLRYQRGVANRNKRLEQAKKAFDKAIPEKDEIMLLMSVLAKKKPDPSKPVIPRIHMKHTTASKSLLMHQQDRNVQGKIFGGFLMREMIELAWFSCMKLSKGQEVRFKDIQDVIFHEPVEVGNGLVVDSVVSYVEDCHMVVRVVASKLHFEKQESVKTCEVYIIFETMDNSKLTQVIPQTFEEGMTFLMGKRKLINAYG